MIIIVNLIKPMLSTFAVLLTLKALKETLEEEHVKMDEAPAAVHLSELIPGHRVVQGDASLH